VILVFKKDHGENMREKKAKVVLITGCSSGMGFQTAVHLANQGYKVYAGLRNCKKDKHLLTQAISQNKNKQENLVPLQLDVTSSKQIKAAIKQIITNEKHLDVLVNNAGYGLFGPVEDCSMAEIKQQFEVNLFGAIELTHAAIPHFRKQSFGRIICISSIVAINNLAVLGTYSATKAALEAIGFSWAGTLFPWNIAVTLVEPGATNTSFPDHLIIGSAFKGKKNPYGPMLKKSLGFIKELNAKNSQAQKPKDIALLIEKLIKDKNPPLRTQTSKDVTEEVKSFSKDPTGKIWLKAEQAEMKKLGKL